jgi:hypothetical protein
MTLGGYKPHPEPGDALCWHPGDVIALEENPT